MTEQILRSSLGILVMIIHFSIIALIVWVSMHGGFLFDEMTTTVALISPVLSGYVFGFIYYAIINRKQTTKKPIYVSWLSVFISYFVIILLTTAIILLIFMKAYNKLSFEEFKITLTISEIIFGACIGVILTPLLGGSID